jgi:glycosyltransferase involved in cell wall biosynthesis
MRYSRVLFIINSLGKGGAERVVASLANQMVKQCIEVHIILIFNNIEYHLDDRIVLHILDKTKKLPKHLKFLMITKYSKKLAQLIQQKERKRKFDLITAHLPFSHLLTTKQSSADEIFYVVHTIYSKKFPKNNPLFKFILRRLYNNKNLIAVSQGLAHELLNTWNITPKHIRVIHNPIDLVSIKKSLNNKTNITNQYILGVGRLVRIKRFDILIRAFAKSSLRKNYKLVILGEGPDENILKKLVNNLQLNSKVIFAGWQNNPYIWMQNSKLFILSSEYETFPMVLLEALACGTPAISTNCDYGPREILTGVLSEYLVPVNNIRVLANKMDIAVTNYPQIKEQHTSPFNIDNIITEYFNAAR